jgi:protein tyrosine/serine phosphatase
MPAALAVRMPFDRPARAERKVGRVSTTASRWIDLEGADNARDLGGLPTDDGRRVRPGRLIRSDSLQGLTPADVRHLVDDLHVRAVADLRTGVEVTGEGPGPMIAESLVEVHHLSLFPEPVDGVEVPEDGPVVLPWQDRDGARTEDERRRGAAGIYLGYLDDRADSVLDALRLIAGTEGATIVHCAAGKDRTGVVVAFALAEVGVAREAIVEDYALSAERVEAILARLVTRRPYAANLVGDEPVDKHKPRAVTMERVFEAMDTYHGGIPAWLRAHGWTEPDADRLRRRLLD